MWRVQQHTQRSAFTIIELLVVMTIIVTLMGLGLGAWVGSAQTSETIATQQLVHSMIQQARNRSIASGEPVILHIYQDKGIITGLQKNDLWYQKHVWTWNPGPPLPAALAPVSPGPHRPLFRDENGGFSLRCRVNAPPAGTAGSTVIPLLLLTATGNDNDISNAHGAIELWRVPQFINHDGTVVKVADAWSIVGWLGTRPSYPGSPGDINSWNTFIKGDRFVREWNFDDDDADTANTLSSLDQQRYNMKPYTGDHWMDIELVYDNANLHLYRDGQKVDFYNAEKHGALSFTPTLDEAIDIYAASHTRSSTEFLSTADMRDAALLQIGTGDEAYIPGGLRSLEDYKIVCTDGTITCYGEAGNTIDTLVFTDGDTTAAASFEISIGPDGAILNNKMYSYEEITEEKEEE